MSKPVIVLVPGAWHSPSGFSPLTKYLIEHGYTVEGVSLASVGSSPPQPNFDADIEVIASTIRKHADQGSDIIVLFHSYGGIPGSSACKGLLKADRAAEGKSGGVIHLIYCCAFAVDEGVCIMDTVGGAPPAWWDMATDGKSMIPNIPIEKFYNDIDDKKVLDELVSSLKPQSYGAFWSKNKYEAWRDVESTYVVCEKDEAIPVQAQLDMVANVNKVIQEKGGKGSMQQVIINASHSPFVSRPEELGRIVRSTAGERV